jgi:UDP-galactopyranose mutase
MIFLVQNPHSWRGIRQRPHHIFSRYAKQGHGVRWVEPRYLRWLVDRRKDFFSARHECPQPNLQVTPVTLINGERFPLVCGYNRKAVANAMTTGSIPGEGPRVLWIYNPHEGHLADTVAHDFLVYDIMDEYRGFSWSPPRIAREEDELLRRSDWVFAGTGALYDARKGQASGRIDCILSGVESSHFAQVKHAASQNYTRDRIHQKLLEKFRHVIGYAGMIDQRVDQELLIRLAGKFSDWCFILIGPVRVDTSRLEVRKNICLLGSRPYSDLPAYYHTWDAAMLPFIKDELTRHINPTKMLEYAAARKPILARALPDVKRYYHDGSWIYDDRRTCFEQLQKIEDGLENRDDEFNARLEIAGQWSRDRSWDAIALKMFNRVQERIALKRS